MRGLDLVQQQFQHYVIQGDNAIVSDIITTEKVAAITRLDIYRDAYYLRLLEVLSQDYNVLHTLLGDETFFALGRNYFDKHPSQYRSVRWVGAKLASYMQTVPDYAAKPFLQEMAVFEWALTESFDVVDTNLLTLADMANIPMDAWPNMVFSLHPSVQRLNFNWNVVNMWHAIKEEAVPVPEELPTATPWLVWRRDLEVQFCSLTPDESYLLDATFRGETFSDICAGLCEWIAEEEVAMHAASLLKRFILDELFSAVAVKE
jgi:hypothetical protein